MRPDLGATYGLTEAPFDAGFFSYDRSVVCNDVSKHMEKTFLFKTYGVPLASIR